MIFTKDMVGKRIFALPTGNNARGGSAGKITEFEVVSIGRKFVDLSVVSEGRKYSARKYDQKTGSSGCCNSGYKFFESLDAIADYNYGIELAAQVSLALTGYKHSVTIRLSVDQLERIKTIIKEPQP